jgi:hypothetical protein
LIVEKIMGLTASQLAAALDAISEDIENAANHFQQYVHTDDEWVLGNCRWGIELAYSKLMVLCEVLQLPMLHAEIVNTLKSASGALCDSKDDPDGEPHLKWAGPARRFHQTLQAIFLTESSQTVTKDLEAIVRDSLYTIVDTRIYGSTPQNETDVHARIEGIIRCVFPDTLHKPALHKPIKNFEPDSGIPSISTIIEYKFLSDRSQIGPVADQILADTRGYTSDMWKAFLYVIYETERFRPETEWRQLLRECGSADNVSAVVLSGATVLTQRRKRRRVSGWKMKNSTQADPPGEALKK